VGANKKLTSIEGKGGRVGEKKEEDCNPIKTHLSGSFSPGEEGSKLRSPACGVPTNGEAVPRKQEAGDHEGKKSDSSGEKPKKIPMLPGRSSLHGLMPESAMEGLLWGIHFFIKEKT